MKHKIVAAVSTIAAMIFIVCITIFGEAEYITRDDLNNTQNRAVMEKIASIVLNDSQRNDEISPNEIVKVDVNYGDFRGTGNKDAVISTDFGPRYTLLSVYEENDGKYNFVGEVGLFGDTDDLRVVYLENKGQDTIFIDEIFNDKIGAFERMDYDKGFIWDKASNGFVNIYSYPVTIRSDWNATWDTPSIITEPSNWERLTQTTKSLLENGDNPIIKSTYHQEYLVSSDNNALNVPLNNTYNLVKERDLERDYYWNDEWLSFIIEEKVENSTGEKVAVLALWSDLPYFLPEYENVDEANDYNDLVKIKRKDGSTAIVNKNTLSDVKEVRKISGNDA